jgi:hypothetical protein
MSLALGGKSLAEGGASLAVGGAFTLAKACLVALASVATGGGAAASVPARNASALYWAWAPAAATCWAVFAWAAVLGTGGRAGMLAKSGVVVLASASACCALSVGNWLSGTLSSLPSKPVGSRSDMVWHPAVPIARPSASIVMAKGRAYFLLMSKLPSLVPELVPNGQRPGPPVPATLAST